MGNNTILDVKDLCVGRINDKNYHPHVRHVSFSLEENKVLGLIGESGSGKTLTSLALLKLLPWGANWKLNGEVLYRKNHRLTNLFNCNEEDLRAIRGKEIAMIFQEPSSSLNPVLKVGWQVGEALLREGLENKLVKERVKNLFNEVNLSEDLTERYPHQLSGGQIQRVMIAMALAQNPKILIADEPTTALDSITQRNFLAFLDKIRAKFNLSILFITHDLHLIQGFADDVVVMRNGHVLEKGPTTTIFSGAKNKHTQELIKKGLFFSQFYLNKQKEAVKPVANRNSVLEVSDIFFEIRLSKGLLKKETINILNNVNFTIFEGEIVGIIGASGAGKTTLARIIVKLIEPSSGRVAVLGKNLDEISGKALRKFRKGFQIVFQSPLASLNPLMKVGDAIAEILLTHQLESKANVKSAVGKVLQNVGLTEEYYGRFPYQLSTGQRQRVVIARALCLNPKLLICDEPFASLDIKVKIEIFRLLLQLRKQMNLTILLISHDLEVIKAMCERVLVLDNGSIVDEGATEYIFNQPDSPVTKALVQSFGG